MEIFLRVSHTVNRDDSITPWNGAMPKPKTIYLGHVAKKAMLEEVERMHTNKLRDNLKVVKNKVVKMVKAS